MNGGWQRLTKIVRSTMFAIVNKEFLIFLFFLALSGVFWLLMALNETYEMEYSIPVSLTGVPKNAIITTPMADTVKVTVRDKGYTLATYKYGHSFKTINVHFSNYANQRTLSGSVPAADLQKMVYQRLFSSSRITQMKPDRLQFYFNYGLRKVFPVTIDGKFYAAKNYYISQVIAIPSRVVVYASEHLLDSIKSIHTEVVSRRNIYDTTMVTVKLKSIQGAKFVPSTVKLRILPDVLTEGRVEVPIKAINMPEGKILRTFPQRVEVRFVVGVSQYNLVRPDQFVVVADYKELMAKPSDKCNLYLQTVPKFVSKARLELKQVDYLIEQP
jgi:hypothetical protein